MSLSMGMILFGSLLIYAGWKDRSVAALARGDNQTPKPPIVAGAAP